MNNNDEAVRGFIEAHLDEDDDDAQLPLHCTLLLGLVRPCASFDGLVPFYLHLSVFGRTC